MKSGRILLPSVRLAKMLQFDLLFIVHFGYAKGLNEGQGTEHGAELYTTPLRARRALRLVRLSGC